MAFHRERPVRTYPSLVRDLERDQVGPTPPPKRDYEREMLELLSTQQLRAIAKREGAKVPQKYGVGMRARFIDAILERRRRCRGSRRTDATGR